MVNAELRNPDNADEIDRLPRAYRLALAYAPPSMREDYATLFALDDQFARFVIGAKEPIIAQMRLAWWRDRFGEPVEHWPHGNALLARLSGWGEAAHGLTRVVDGWEVLLGERPHSRVDLKEFAAGRAAGWRSLTHRQRGSLDGEAIDIAGQRFALVDAGWAMLGGTDREVALDLANTLEQGARLPRQLKPLTVLDALARRALSENRPVLSRPGDLLTALRAGVFGR